MRSRARKLELKTRPSPAINPTPSIPEGAGDTTTRVPHVSKLARFTNPTLAKKRGSRQLNLTKGAGATTNSTAAGSSRKVQNRVSKTATEKTLIADGGTNLTAGNSVSVRETTGENQIPDGLSFLTKMGYRLYMDDTGVTTLIYPASE